MSNSAVRAVVSFLSLAIVGLFLGCGSNEQSQPKLAPGNNNSALKEKAAPTQPPENGNPKDH